MTHKGQVMVENSKKHWHFIIFQKVYWHMFHRYQKTPVQESYSITWYSVSHRRWVITTNESSGPMSNRSKDWESHVQSVFIIFLKDSLWLCQFISEQNQKPKDCFMRESLVSPNPSELLLVFLSLVMVVPSKYRLYSLEVGGISYESFYILYDSYDTGQSVYTRKGSDWSSAGEASHYVGVECVAFLGRISNRTPGS